jgi:pyruvate,water dikinase
MPISAPTDFPVNWESSDDERLCWTQERTHFAYPAIPLDFEFIAKKIYVGFNKATHIYDVPITGDVRHINTYIYETLFYGSPEEFIAKRQLSEEKLNKAMENLNKLWENEWLPEIKEHIAYWETYNLSDASMPALLEHLNETEKSLDRLWEIHFLLYLPMMLAISLFEEMYQELFDQAEQFEPYELIAGFENKAIESGQQLWELSHQALNSPVVYQVLTNNAASEVVAKLSESVEGQAFWGKLKNYLQEYGQRGDKFSLNSASWIEVPTPVIKNLKDYLAQTERNMTAEREEMVVRREQKIAKAREQLQGYPQPVVTQFEFLLKAAQEANVLTEDHGYWIDFQTIYQTRQVLLEFGRRLAKAGVIGHRDEVFYLTLKELKETAENLPNIDRLLLVNERRLIEKKFTSCTPPFMLGTPPPEDEEPPDDPFTRMFIKFDGTPPSPSDAPSEVKGNAGSPGIVQGTAKIVHQLTEADKLAPGDILVTETTIQSWTPLFGTISAIVTDRGGILSHSAVVAREYGIPAVVGTNTATSIIQDGQTIEVNGDTGMVQILS